MTLIFRFSPMKKKWEYLEWCEIMKELEEDEREEV